MRCVPPAALGLPFTVGFRTRWLASACRSFTTTINGYPDMAGMWLSGEDLPHRGNERKISKGLNRGNAKVSETQLAFLRSIDTPTVWPEPRKKP
jgi:hypothetical protein